MEFYLFRALARRNPRLYIPKFYFLVYHLEKIVLCDVPNSVVSDIEKSFTDMMYNSGFPNIKLEKKIDFTKLYLERLN